MKLGRIFFHHHVPGYNSVKESGLDFVEICCNYDRDNDYVVGEKERFKSVIEESGVEVACLGRWNHELLKDGKIDYARVDYYKELLDTAVYFGARTFVCGCNYDDSISLYKNYTNAIEIFGTLCDHVKDKNIKVAVQNCHWNNFVVSPKQWEVILGEIPELYLKYDPSHAYCRGDDYLAEMSDWGHKIAHMHIKGTTIAGKNEIDDPPAGMDDLKWPAIFSILYARGFDGDLSIEPHSPTWSGDLGDKGVEFTRDYIRKFMLK